MAMSAQNKSVGLEIDTGMVRAVEAAGNPSNVKLVAMAGSPLPLGAVEEGMIVQPEGVGSALRNLWASGAIRHRKVLLGVSNQGVLVRYATIPKVAPDKLPNVIRFHAQEHLPLPLESVVLDYQVIGEMTNEEGTSLLEILLVAARRDMLNGFIQALDMAGLEAIDIDVSTLALMRILPQQALSRTVAVVNVANGLSNILVAAQGQPRLARLVSVKINDLSQALGYPLEQVIDQTAFRPGEARTEVDQWMRSLVAETSSSLSYYQNQDNATPIEAVIINGRGALIQGLADLLTAELELPVRVIDPFAEFSGNVERSSIVGIERVEYAICAGLARRGLEGS